MSLKRIDRGVGSQLTEPCFCKEGGTVYWTNGEQYTEDGSAPGRVEVFCVVAPHGIIMRYEWVENLELATGEEKQAFMKRVRNSLQGERATEVARHRSAMEDLGERLRAWESRASK